MFVNMEKVKLVLAWIMAIIFHVLSIGSMIIALCFFVVMLITEWRMFLILIALIILLVIGAFSLDYLKRYYD